MDKNVQIILNSKLKQIEIKLEQELIKIDEKYTINGLIGSGRYKRERNLAIIKANEEKNQIKAELEKDMEDSKNNPSLQFPPYLDDPPYNELPHPALRSRWGIC